MSSLSKGHYARDKGNTSKVQMQCWGCLTVKKDKFVSFKAPFGFTILEDRSKCIECEVGKTCQEGDPDSGSSNSSSSGSGGSGSVVAGAAAAAAVKAGAAAAAVKAGAAAAAAVAGAAAARKAGAAAAAAVRVAAVTAEAVVAAVAPVRVMILECNTSYSRDSNPWVYRLQHSTPDTRSPAIIPNGCYTHF